MGHLALVRLRAKPSLRQRSPNVPAALRIAYPVRHGKLLKQKEPLFRFVHALSKDANVHALRCRTTISLVLYLLLPEDIFRGVSQGVLDCGLGRVRLLKNFQKEVRREL
jgi:hypothetical protein